jgi:hypothetical protein
MQLAMFIPENKVRSEFRVVDISENRTLGGNFKKHPPHDVAKVQSRNQLLEDLSKGVVVS